MQKLLDWDEIWYLGNSLNINATLSQLILINLDQIFDSTQSLLIRIGNAV